MSIGWSTYPFFSSKFMQKTLPCRFMQGLHYGSNYFKSASFAIPQSSIPNSSAFSIISSSVGSQSQLTCSERNLLSFNPTSSPSSQFICNNNYYFRLNLTQTERQAHFIFYHKLSPMQKYLNQTARFLCSWQHGFVRKSFKELEQKDIDHFRSIMKPNQVITDSSDLEIHNQCFIKMVKGKSKLLLCPNTTQQVSGILKYCNQNKLAVVPQGGNTGLVGGSVPIFDEIILSLKNMNKIEKFDPVSSIVTVQAGVILQKLNQYLQKQGFETPLDLGAKGSCQIGGNASTNAGGKYVIKYGSFRSHILGLEAVLPSGQILDMRSEIFKDNTGYDLKQLFIGGQGTMGVITKLNIHCPKIDKIRKIMAFKTDKYQNIIKSLPKLKSMLGKHLNALQYLNGVSYNAVTSKLHDPIFESSVQMSDHVLFVESSTEDLDNLFEEMSDFQDSVMSNNDKQYAKIWKIRQDVILAATKYGKVLSYDISFDVKQWDSMLNELKQATNTQIFGYGHIGDGNLHVNIILKEGQEFKDSYIFEKIAKKKGSISAQHGVGLHKPKYLHLQKSPHILNIYKQLKQIFDPNGIMNPYKVVPE